MDKLVQTLDCSSLQEGHKTKSCPSHQSRTRHSFRSLWLLYFSNHTKSFWGGHGSAHALYPAVTMPRKDLVTGQARTVISVSRGRKCSFGFNCLQKTFFQGIYFFPALLFPCFFSDYYSQTSLRVYSQEHHTQWRSQNDFFWHRYVLS